MNVKVRPQASCHPDRPHYGKGLCRSCWAKTRGEKTRALERARYAPVKHQSASSPPRESTTSPNSGQSGPQSQWSCQIAGSTTWVFPGTPTLLGRLR
jgi:hypothetical protein